MALSWIRKLPPAAQEIVLDGPAMLPPVGIIPDFENPPNRNDIGYVTNGLCIAALSAVVLIRSYAKLVCMRKVEIEDYLALIAVGTWSGYVYGNFWFISFSGVFVHQWNIRIRDTIEIMHMLHICSNLAAVTIGLVKTAILVEWNRIFVPRGTRNYFFWTSHTILLVHVLFHMSWILAENLGCTPYQKNWDQTIAGGHCIDQKLLFIPAAIINLITNFVVLLLPQKVIWDLQLSLKNKIGVSIVFAVGIFACIAASFRLAESIIFYKSVDLIYTLAAMDHWILVEMTCQFVVFCAPTTPIIFKSLRATGKVTSASKTWANLSSEQFNPNNRRVPFLRKASVMNKVLLDSRRLREMGSDDSLYSLPFISPTGPGPTTEITVQPPLPRARTSNGILCTTRITHEEEYVESRGRGDSPTYPLTHTS